MSVLKLSESIFQCVQEPSRWEDTLNDYVNHFDLLSACIFTVHDFESMRSGLYFSDALRNDLAADLRKKIEDGNDSADHEAYARIMRLEPWVPHDELSIMGVNSHDELPPSDVRAGGEAIGVKMRVPTVLNRQGPWLEGLFAHTKRDDDHIAYKGHSDALSLMPVFSGAMALGRVFEGLKARYNAALAALDHLGLGVFLLDERGQLVERNTAASRILDQRDGLSLARNGRIFFANEEADAVFQDTINGLARDLLQSKRRLSGMMAVPRRSNLYDYLVTVRPLLDTEGEMHSGFRGLFVIVIDPERKGVLSSEGIAALGNLTEAETEVADALVKGFKAAEIADRRSVAENTIRIQIKSLLQKLRCGSQSDVIRVAAATRLPFAE